MAYDYQRRVALCRTAASVSHTTYEEAITKAQTDFVGAVGEGVFDYVKTLHGRIGKRSPWSDVSGFNSWDYGSVHPSSRNGGFEIRVYQKDGAIYPRDIDPVIDILIEFSAGVGVVANVGSNNRIYVKRLPPKVSPSQVALNIGAGWEKLLTGSVDYGE